MKSIEKEYQNIDEYIGTFPQNIQKILEKIRLTIKQAAPDSEEVISYGMPAFKLNSVLVYFAVHKNHIGFYPTPKPIEVFKKELISYETSKGAVKFPLDKPIPFGLIKKITKFRLKEDLEDSIKKQNKLTIL